MTFTTKKWFFFFITAILLCISCVICRTWVTGQNKTFRIPLSLEMDSKISEQDNHILLYTNLKKEESLLPIIKDKISHQRLLESQLADFFRKYNSLPKGSEFYIGEDLYHFLSNFVTYFHPLEKEFRGSVNDREYQFLPITECSSSRKDVSFVGCLPFSSYYFTLNMTSVSGKVSYSLKKLTDVHLFISDEDLEFTLATYQLSLLNDLFIAQNIYFYIISYNGMVLVESKDKRLSWPVQYGRKSKDLYYLYNESVYLPQGFHNPSEFVEQTIDYGTQLSMIDNLSNYNRIKGIGSFGKIIFALQPSITAHKPDTSENKSDS